MHNLFGGRSAYILEKQIFKELFCLCIVIRKTSIVWKNNCVIKVPRMCARARVYVCCGSSDKTPVLHLSSEKPMQFPVFYEVAANNLRPPQPAPSTVELPALNKSGPPICKLDANSLEANTAPVYSCMYSPPLNNASWSKRKHKFKFFSCFLWDLILHSVVWKCHTAYFLPYTSSVHPFLFLTADNQNQCFWSVIHSFFFFPLSFSSSCTPTRTRMINKWSNKRETKTLTFDVNHALDHRVWWRNCTFNQAGSSMDKCGAWWWNRRGRNRGIPANAAFC